MMNWFKHYANADKDSRLQRLKTDYGFWGMGIYWTIMERVVCYGEGCYPRNELMGMKLNRRDTGVIKAVLDRYDLFLTDEFGMVRCSKSVQKGDTIVPESDKNVHECGTKTPTLCTNSAIEEKPETPDNKEDAADSLTHTRVEEKREEKKREEENTLLNPPCEEVVDDDDRRGAPCGYPHETDNAHHWAPTRDAPTMGGEASDNNCVPCNSVPSVSSVVCSSVIHELRTNRIWQEAVCMNSGYSVLLMRHFDRAVDIFLQHVRAGADEVELTDRRRAMNYFRNFTKLSHPAGRALKEELEKRDKLQATSYERQATSGHPDDSLITRSSSLVANSLVADSPFEDPPGPNGERSYCGGRPLPPDAPPRPSARAEWDEAEDKWWEGY